MCYSLEESYGNRIRSLQSEERVYNLRYLECLNHNFMINDTLISNEDTPVEMFVAEKDG